MEKIKLNWKLNLCAFFLPVGIVFLLCIFHDVFPFGENCVLHVDMYHQYEPFFTELMYKLKNGKSLFYSFRLGLGSDFIALSAYYLASPLNWLLFIWPSSYVIEFMTLAILIKIGFCGLGFAVYLWHHTENRKLGGSVLFAEYKNNVFLLHANNGLDAVFFAACYAITGYMAAYYWNIMWLDVMALAPVVLLGLKQLVKEGECRLYCLSLAAATLANFYIAFMLCIFLVMMYGIFCMEELHDKKERLLSFGRFSLYSLLAGGMGAILLIPAAIILSYSGSSGVSFPKEVKWYFDLISMLARHCIGVDVYTGREHWPNLYCGSAVFLFLALYFLNRNISWKKKAVRFGFLLFFWAGFSNNVLDFIWHGLHFPDSLPGRESFLYIFLVLMMSYEAYRNQEGNTILHIIIGIAVSELLVTAANFLTDLSMVARDSLLMTGVLAAGYGLLMILRKNRSKTVNGLAGCMLLILVTVELCANYNDTGLYTTSRTSYTQNWDSIQGLLEKVSSEEEEPFYRVERLERLTKNDAEVYGYASSTIFSSLMNIGVSRFYQNMGMEGGKNYYSYSGATALTSAMLSVKYVIAGNPHEESPLRVLAAEDGKNYVYKNQYALPLGFMVEPDLIERWNIEDKEPVNNLNRLAYALGAEEEMLTAANGQVDALEDRTLITVNEDCYLYGTYTDHSVTDIKMANGERSRNYNKADHGYILDLGWCRAGDVVEVTNKPGVSNFQVEAYQLNMESFRQAYDKLNEQPFVLDQFHDTRIEGHITAEKPGNLVFSIPMEEGWQVYVDGKKTDCKAWMESFMEIPLSEGEHRIVLKYRTPGIIAGAGISFACLGSFLFICFLKYRCPMSFNQTKKGDKK